jgi:thiol-disulfide isomerase/thioredoxin
VLIDFWTYSCINCLRAVPYVEAWSRKYKDAGLVVIGVHSPEFAFERDPANVARATREFGLSYPIAIDSDHTIWNAFDNAYWPAHYLIDAKGVIRFQHVGEGGYDDTESLIQDLLKERNGGASPAGAVQVSASGVQAAPDLESIQSPETYVGYERQENYASPQPLAQDRAERYTSPATLELNQWALGGEWTVGGERAVAAAGARIVFRFHARDLHLVLGPGPDGKPVRFRVSIDGRPPLDSHGLDVDSGGTGRVTGYRLYQLIRQHETSEDRTFQIEFLDPGVQAFAFTFG